MEGVEIRVHRNMITNRLFIKTLEKYKDKEFLLVQPNGGNWGDDLIRIGTMKILKQLGISYTETTDHHRDLSDDVVILIHGSGGIGATYPGVADVGVRYRELNPDNIIIYAPTTAMIKEEDLKILKEEFGDINHNFIFFAREKKTYRFMLDNFDFKILLDECPSLYLTKEDFTLSTKPDKSVKKKVLFLREDTEKIGFPFFINSQNYEIVFDPVQCKTFDEWYNVHNIVDEIHTNRCHSAILGLILGKKVTIFNNYYHKNRSMWEHSLKKRGVKWIDES